MKISVQIYSIREAGDLDVQLKLARDAGFEWLETVATHGLSPHAFAEKIAAYDLKVSSMHVGLALLESDLPMIVQACHLTSCPLIIMPWEPMGERPASASGWAALGSRLGKIGDQLRAQGLRLAYHNHDWEFLSYEGRTALDWLFSAATPEQLGWEADLGWVCRAGADPWMWTRRYADRLVAVHAKDIAACATAVTEDGWATLGQGTVPWPALFAALKSKVGLFVFEHDHPVNFQRTLSESHAFMKQHLA
jgi:sugar phosphate isomerase/epimerase